MPPTPAASPATPLRIGILGAARITPRALIAPARAVPGIEVAAIAARDPARARDFAARHAIPTVHGSYADLINDPTIHAVYNPLPNHLHAPWSICALQTGKHVLCEKPMASNAAEAAQMAAAAHATGLVLMEAFHYRYHPLTLRALEILAGGELGAVRHVETIMCIPLYRFRDIRYRYDLAGGAVMDVGCYTIHLLRTLAGAEPTVTRAQAACSAPNVDRRMEADFQFADGRTGRIVCSLWSRTLLRFEARIQCERGELRMGNPWLPQFYNRLRILTPSGERRETLPKVPTYTYQLEAFAAAVRNGQPPITGPTDAVANMRVIDAVYQAAGLPLRGG